MSLPSENVFTTVEPSDSYFGMIFYRDGTLGRYDHDFDKQPYILDLIMPNVWWGRDENGFYICNNVEKKRDGYQMSSRTSLALENAFFEEAFLGCGA